jgi:pimeloyl-ACP methyl ester carboxylesterase
VPEHSSAERTVSTPDGRELRILEAGDPTGPVVIVHHGSPGSRVLYRPWAEDAAERGLRLIGFDRPGYGGSTAHPGRRIADAAGDVEAIVDALGIDAFLAWGISGGGPHALACGALLGDRVKAVATLASFAPYAAEGLDWFAGMGSYNVEEFGLALEGRKALRPLVTRNVGELLQPEQAASVEALGSILSPVDAAVVTGDAADFFYGAGLRVGIEAAVEGLIDDDLAFVQPWGFDVRQIQAPVLVWHGAQDWMIPFAHGEWLASKLPTAEARLIPEEGHLTLAVRRVGETHAWLLSHAGRGCAA